MSVSLSELDNRIVMNLPMIADYMTLFDIHNATVQTLNILTMQSRSSDINVLLATSDPFSVDSIPYDVTDIIGKATPAWVELRNGDAGDGERWFPVRIVPLQQLAEYNAIGAMACAFHGEEPDDNTSQATQYLSFTFTPGSLVRIRFDRDLERTEMDADILLPDNLSEYCVLRAVQSLIPRLKNMVALGLRRDTDARVDVQLVMQTLDGIYNQNVIDMKPLRTQHQIWCYGDRSKQTFGQLPTPKSSALYVNGRGYGNYLGGGRNT